MIINWYNDNGFYSAPFNAEYFALDGLGYLDALRKGEDMYAPAIYDAQGNNVTAQYL